MSVARPKLFLSYGRGDDEPFVKSLYERLVAKEFPVWWDRKDMPSRGLTFLKEIREAIRASDRVVVVIGPHCVASDYCRAEWQAALAESKVVNPLLRLGEHTLLPPELASLHCPDFRNDSQFNAAFKEALRNITEPVPPLGALFGGVPDVPPHFQPRPDDLSQLAAEVLIDEKKPVTLTGPQRVTVLSGMGGSGKSVLAASFARSTCTRRSFGDGVYWLNGSETTEPLSLMTQLARQLGPALQGQSDPIILKSAIAEALQERSALLVLDNAWEIEQIEPLIDALGPACRLIVTARGSKLATASGARSLELGLLSEEAALQHLADWAGVAPEELPPAAREVARECGYLPFALALNGAMHKHGKGVAWSDLLDALRSSEIDYAEERFKSYPYPTVLKCIQVSMDVLEAEDAAAAARLREVAAFHSNGGIPEAAIAVLWGQTGNLANRHVSKLLLELDGRSLLRLEGEPPARRALIHDLQLDYLRRVSNASELNRTLLGAYERAFGKDWPSVRADGYIHQHLVSHLLADGRNEETNALLNASTPDGSNAWFEANDAADNIAGYLADLERASVGGADETRMIRLALMRVSVENMLTQIPGEFFISLVRVEQASPTSALAAANLIEDPEQRVSALLDLLPQIPEADRRDVLAKCLSVVRSGGNEPHGRYLPRIAKHFSGSERAALLREALVVTRTITIAEYRAQALGAILDVADDGLRSEIATEAAAAVEESVSSASDAAVRAVLPHLPTLAPRLLEIARTISDPFLQAMMFEEILPHLPGPDRAAPAREGIECFERSRSKGLWIVFSLARHIPDFDSMALIRRAASDDPRQVRHLVEKLPELFFGDDLKAALDGITAETKDLSEPDRTDSRISLLPHLEKEKRKEEVASLLQSIDALEYNSWRRDAYLEILEHLEREQLPQVKKRLARIEDDSDVLQSAAELSRYSDEEVGREVLSRLKILPPSREKFLALLALAESAQKPTCVTALEAALTLRGYFTQWHTMSDPIIRLGRLVAPAELNELIGLAWQAALNTPGFLGETEFLKLLPVLSEEAQVVGFRSLLTSAEALSHHQQQSWSAGQRLVSDNSAAIADTLRRIAPHLPAAILPDALDAVQRMSNDYWRGIALCHLLPLLKDHAHDAALADLLTLSREGVFQRAAESDERVLGGCLGFARAVMGAHGRARKIFAAGLRDALARVEATRIPLLLEAVTPVLKPDEVQALVERGLAHPNSFTSAAESKYLPTPERWSFLLGIIMDLLGKSIGPVRIESFSSAVEALLEAPLEIRAQAWEQICRGLHGERAGLAHHLALMEPLATSLDRNALLGRVARDLLTVLAWWP